MRIALLVPFGECVYAVLVIWLPGFTDHERGVALRWVGLRMMVEAVTLAALALVAVRLAL